MKNLIILFVSGMSLFTGCQTYTQSPTNQEKKAEASTPAQPDKQLFIDVHDLKPGKVTYADVAAAHEKDLATEGKYGVKFIKYWVDEAAGKVFCL